MGYSFFPRSCGSLLPGRRLIFENMYLGDSHVLLNTLCWCCHRKIWLHSGEDCYHCRTEPLRP
ncbi:uncharacterized protein [Gorilla gorilla gorilla]|nr:uncharacterized LOC128092246 homolog isoform X1 [Pongo abelii]XP_054969652.1 uncharacterized LOC128092246 homolog [Pan paniscus]XP_055247079.1 uncharacterized LOC128092246 homolog [Gorilla gorilla gorilla]